MSYCTEKALKKRCKRKNELDLQYIRSKREKSDLWRLIAGDIDNEFVNDIEK